MPERGRRPGRPRGSTRRGDGRVAARGQEMVETNQADDRVAVRGQEKVESHRAEDAFLPGRAWKIVFYGFVVWLAVTLTEYFSGFYLFTNFANVGFWTNEIQGEILFGVLFGVYMGYRTGDFVDFMKWGGGCFLVLRFLVLGMHRFALA